MALIDGQNIDRNAERTRLKKIMRNTDVIKFTFRIPTTSHRKFKEMAFKQKKIMSDILNELLLTYIGKQNEKNQDDKIQTQP